MKSINESDRDCTLALDEMQLSKAVEYDAEIKTIRYVSDKSTEIQNQLAHKVQCILSEVAPYASQAGGEHVINRKQHTCTSTLECEKRSYESTVCS